MDARLRCLAMLLVAMACLACGACAQVDLDGKDDGNSFTEWSGFRRPRDAEHIPSGVSDKARQIERDLGVE